MTRENYGVVAQTPVTKKDWKNSGRPLEDWDGAYVVYLISDETNSLHHDHLSEICLEKLRRKLPEDLNFLNLLSAYFKNDGNVPDAEKIQKTIEENIVVRRINYFFEKRS